MKAATGWIFLAVPALALWIVHVAVPEPPAEGPAVAEQRAAAPVQRDSTRLWPERATTLSGESARQIVLQCSRPAPKLASVTGVWTPTRAQLAAFDSALTVHLRARLARERRHPPVSAYHRQFAGLVIGGRRIVYVNGFAADEDVRFFPSNWRAEPVSACDGGIGYFGAEYDVERRSLAELHFNGVG